MKSPPGESGVRDAVEEKIKVRYFRAYFLRTQAPSSV